MKAVTLALAFAAALGALVLLADDVEATGNCGLPVADRCHGMSMVGTTTGGVASGRCFFWTTLNTPPACSTGGIGSTSNQAWEVDAGACQTWYYWDVANGAAPPAVPNKLTLRTYFDVLGAAYRTFLLNGAEPAQNGVANAYSFCATDTGSAGGSPRAGTWYFEIIANKDNGPGGVGNYLVVSNGVGTQDTSFDAGGFRAKTIVSGVTSDSYSAAYGAGADEVIAITSTFTQPGADNNLETRHNGIIDEATLAVGQAGAVVDVDATTTLAQDFVADNTFPFASNPYVATFNLNGNSALLGEKGTVLATTGHGACFVRFSDTFGYCDTDITIDTRIRMDSDATGGFASADETDRSYVGGTCSGALIEVFNRGESACTVWGLVNARDEYLSRSVTFARRDASNTVCVNYGSLTPTNFVYLSSGTFPTSGACTTAATLAGSPRHLLVTNTDQSYASGAVYSLSSLYLLQPWTDLDATRGPAPDLEFFVRGDGAGGDDSDTIHNFCEVRGVRNDVAIDTSGSAVSQQLKDPTGATRATRTTDTGADGWTPTSQDLLATTPLGDDWTAPCSVAFNGNTGSDTLTFEVGVEGGGGGETVYFTNETVADPLVVNAGYWNGTTGLAIQSMFLDGRAREGVAELIDIDIWDAVAWSQVIDDDHPVEVGLGSYRYNVTDLPDGIYFLRTTTPHPNGTDTVGADNIVVVDNDLAEHRENSLEMDTLNDFNGMGLDGFLLNIFWLAVMMLGTWRMSIVGPRYLGLLLASMIGLVIQWTPLRDELEYQLAGFFLLALAIFIIALLNRFGTEKPRAATS